MLSEEDKVRRLEEGEEVLISDSGPEIQQKEKMKEKKKVKEGKKQQGKGKKEKEKEMEMEMGDLAELVGIVEEKTSEKQAKRKKNGDLTTSKKSVSRNTKKKRKRREGEEVEKVVVNDKKKGGKRKGGKKEGGKRERGKNLLGRFVELGEKSGKKMKMFNEEGAEAFMNKVSVKDVVYSDFPNSEPMPEPLENEEEEEYMLPMEEEEGEERILDGEENNLEEEKGQEEENVLHEEEDMLEDENSSSSSRLAAPVSYTRIRITENGISLGTNEEFQKKRASAPESNTELFQELPSNGRINAASFRKRSANGRWNEEDTNKFYTLLRQFGTDFELISNIFPGRNRKQIKNKFKKEEKTNPARINEALRNSLPFDFEVYNQLRQKIQEEEEGKEESGMERPKRVPTANVPSGSAMKKKEVSKSVSIEEEVDFGEAESAFLFPQSSNEEILLGEKEEGKDEEEILPAAALIQEESGEILLPPLEQQNEEEGSFHFQDDSDALSDKESSIRDKESEDH